MRTGRHAGSGNDLVAGQHRHQERPVSRQCFRTSVLGNRSLTRRPSIGQRQSGPAQKFTRLTKACSDRGSPKLVGETATTANTP
jgi:hypothetical protein